MGKFNEWSKRPKAKLPKWFGVRPGKKEGDPETPEGEEEEEAGADEEEEEDYGRGGGGRRRGGINRIISGVKTEVLSNAKVTSYIPQSSHCFCAQFGYIFYIQSALLSGRHLLPIEILHCQFCTDPENLARNE